jgi:hypothetical protein
MEKMPSLSLIATAATYLFARWLLCGFLRVITGQNGFTHTARGFD